MKTYKRNETIQKEIKLSYKLTGLPDDVKRDFDIITSENICLIGFLSNELLVARDYLLKLQKETGVITTEGVNRINSQLDRVEY